MTISEIARLAGVSSAAISRYFNGGSISDEKREAIRKVVEETGYRPSAQAQMLRTKKSKTIGVVLPRIDSNSMGKVTAGILEILEGNDYRMILGTTQNSEAKEMEYLTLFNNSQVDGIILIATLLSKKLIRVLRSISVPLVLVGQSCKGYNCIYHDDYNAEYDLTKMLLESGRRKPAYIGVTEQDKAVGAERTRAYCDAVTKAGLAEYATHRAIAEFSQVSGRKQMEHLLKLYPDTDVVICATDRIAVGAHNYLREIGRDQTGEILIAGQGDTTIAAACTPPITTIRYYYEESGRVAAARILEMIRNIDTEVSSEEAVRSVKLGYQLVPR